MTGRRRKRLRRKGERVRERKGLGLCGKTTQERLKKMEEEAR